MIDNPEIRTLDARRFAFVHVTVPKNEIQKAMGPGIQELREVLKAQGVEPTGRWFTHHLVIKPDAWDFEIGLPVAAPIRESGRVKNGTLPATKVARTIYRGGYEGLGDAWGQLMKWIADHGHAPAADLVETYLVDYGDGSDPSKFETELVRPIA